MATTYGKTWWGQQWLGALKQIDCSNRLPRGASYARNGMVRRITFADNVISAKVQGSCRTPYSVTIRLPKFSDSEIDKFVRLICEKPVVLSKLFNRQLDESLAQMAEKAGIPLFPTKWTDLKMRCSCPDWAVPCKHLAAVIYKVSMEIDNNPFLVFSLHGVDLMAELVNRGVAQASPDVMNVDSVDEIYNEPFVIDATITDSVPDYMSLRELALPLSDLLPSSPAFCHNGDFKVAYQKELQYVAKAAGKVLQDKHALYDGATEVLTKHDEVMVEDFTPRLYQRLLTLSSDGLDAFHPTAVAARRILLSALHLVAHGCIVPQIFYETVKAKGRKNKNTLENKEYLVVWQPAMMDENVRNVVGQLRQQQCLLSKVITDLVHSLSHPQQGSVFSDMFFNGVTCLFDEVGDTNIPGGIRSWLDRYFVQAKYQVTLQVQETRVGMAVSLFVDDTPLSDIMTLNKFADVRQDILKQLAILCDVLEGLEPYINDKGEGCMEYTLPAFTGFLMGVIPAMRLLGVKVVMPKALSNIAKPRVTLSMKKQDSKGKTKSYLSMAEMLAFDWRIAIGEEMLTPEKFNEILGSARGLIRFKEQYVYADEALVSKLYKLLSAPPKLKPCDLLQAALSGEYLGTPIQMTDEILQMIREFTSQKDVALPTGINAQLRPYQERGYSWMYRNMRIGFGSIIADDMGLGKTLQVITLLLKIKEEGGLKNKKALVVVPTGLLHNWKAEVARFAPQLSTAIYHGTARNLDDEEALSTDVLLTTYGVVRSDADKLKKRKWQVMVIDEAQNIKNSSTAQSKAIHAIPADAYIAMSGTPVENRMSEFWSIMDFTNKGYLGTQKAFGEQYATPIQKYGDRRVADRFRKVTAPFMMRRLKTDKSIIADLPDKIERNELVTLTSEQAALYQETVSKCMAVIEGMEGEDSQSLFKRQGLVLQMILALKQICNHPTQYLKDNRMDVSLSGKSVMLIDMLRSIVDAGEKVLVFTQFREMGELLQHFIRENLDERPLFYHGGCSLKQRQEMVERFQNDLQSRIFILSLKAAGTGLNLTAASHVIHYDLWWNPAVEAQATDRAYRIGQHNNVQVHRFISQATFEERIDAMIQEKKHLADMTVAVGENWIGKLSNKELHEIFD